MASIGTITGAEQVTKALRAMPASLRKKAVIPALKIGGKIVKNIVVSNIKKDLTDIATHTLEKSIGVYTAKPQRPGDVRVAVAVQGKKLNPKNNQRVGMYGSVREFGKKGQKPKPDFRNSVSQGASPAISAITGEMGIHLDEATEDAKR